MKSNNSTTLTITIVLLVLTVIIAIRCFVFINNNSRSVSKLEPGVTKSNIITIAKFYNGEWGYSLSIPSGNMSTCIWTWAGGTGHVPYSQITYAKTASEKHTINHTFDGSFYDFKVTCVDDFGYQYIGAFPEE